MEKVGEGNRTTIGVFPPQAYHERPRLFGALEEALPVRFEPRSRGEWASLGAALFLDGEGDPGVTVPAFVAGGTAAGGVPGPVRLGESAVLDRRLHSAVLSEDGIGSGAPLELGGDEP